MFEISWSELLILGIVALVFVGPKELPALLRTLGKYAGTVRRHANEFKSQFDAAMREAELESMRKEVEQMQRAINSEIMSARGTIGETARATQIEPGAPTETSVSSANPGDRGPTTAPPRLEP